MRALAITLLLGIFGAPALAGWWGGKTELAVRENATRRIKNCCICHLWDGVDASRFRELCKKGFRSSVPGGCSGEPEELTLRKSMTELFPGASCENVYVHAGFHGTSGDAKRPFDLSRQLAAYFQASTLCYDGRSCSIFQIGRDDPQRLKAYGKGLASDVPACRFQVSGNQLPGFFGLDDSTNSKVTVVAGPGRSVALEFKDCSTPGTPCPLLKADEETIGFDPKKTAYVQTSKRCAPASGETIKQWCCRKPAATDEDNVGEWYPPGKSCPRD